MMKNKHGIFSKLYPPEHLEAMTWPDPAGMDKDEVEALLSAREAMIEDYAKAVPDYTRFIQSPVGKFLLVLLAFRNMIVFWNPRRLG
jgi:hypothetical protein